MNMRLTSIAALLFVLTALPLEGQEAASQYTLEQCIELGLKHNLEMLRARNDIDRSQTYRREAVGAFLPSVSARGSWTRYDEDQIGFRGDGFYTSRNAFSYNVQAGLTLFDGMRNFNTADQSLLNMEASEQGLLRTREDVVFRVQQMYFNVLRAEQLTRVAESNLERSRGQLERIREMHAVGSVPQADVYRQQVVVGNDELSVIEARNNFQNAVVDFQALLGIEPSLTFTLAGTDVPTDIALPDVQSYRATLGSFPEMVDAAM
ncbi:MAG: TolC family protein, partial [Bacteroidetes bacterium]|nr:TolC family protein [Bacteroidota bacterium]